MSGATKKDEFESAKGPPINLVEGKENGPASVELLHSIIARIAVRFVFESDAMLYTIPFNACSVVVPSILELYTGSSQPKDRVNVGHVTMLAM
ncbi:hypothetical protein VNO77_23212 [Canavalia gladiata]|uniref:Uncharacterized protein n=1 Tax=Canavalia gladiata TaxID=3824 RepID=A0AAN9L458_CANGL